MLVTGGAVPISIKMDVAKILYDELERAWQHALPGRQVAERDALLRELQQILQQQVSVREPARLRLVRC